MTKEINYKEIAETFGEAVEAYFTDKFKTKEGCIEVLEMFAKDGKVEMDNPLAYAAALHLALPPATVPFKEFNDSGEKGIDDATFTFPSRHKDK